MKHFETNFSQKISNNYTCECCDYTTSIKNDFIKHCDTIKHKTLEMKQNETTPSKKSMKTYDCDNCGKHIYSRTTFWRHRKTCNQTIGNISTEVIKILAEIVKEQKEIVKGQNIMQETVIEMVKNGVGNNSNNIITTNSNNKTAFNLNFYLNDTCKDAMNLSDFISSIKPTLKDLERTGQLGYVEGISSILIDNLNNLEEELRPIHCSDLKRETLYIKENDTWTKDTDDNDLLKKAIKNVAMENMKNILEWKNLYPECTDPDSKKNDKYLKIVSNSMAGLTKEEITKNISKIVSNIARKVVINKSNKKL
jgi:hypothetical protein